MIRVWLHLPQDGGGQGYCGNPDVDRHWGIGIFTATIASFFMIQDEHSELEDLRIRLNEIDQKLDRLLNQRGD